MKKLFALICALLMLLQAAAAAPLELAGELAGTLLYPEEADEASASYIYHYAYPLLPAGDDVCDTINGFYQYAADDAAAFAVPMGGEEAERQGVSCQIDIAYEITCNNEEYFCVKLTSTTRQEELESTILSAQTFARSGEKAGNVVALPYLLGILAGDETDTWLQDRQTAKADDCVRRMLWEEIESAQAEGFPFYEELDEELLADLFYPEEDFYLDETGNPVFFLQAGSVAPVEEGILTYSITLEDLMDEL